MKKPDAADRWIAYRKPVDGARLRLFCFPYAGGGASIYRPWTFEMPSEIEVLPVQLPGRERRLAEPPFTDMAALIEALASALEPYFDRPFAFFGHSMGAAIGYELAQRLRRDGGPEPRRLLVSARRAPQLPDPDEPICDLPDDEFVAHIREMNGTPREVLENPELMELMLPLLRADFELNDRYPPSNAPPLTCPITAFGGLGDVEVPTEEIDAWRQATTGPFRRRMFAGDHFYLHRERPALLNAVAEELLAP